MTIIFINRKSNPIFFSIEKVFATILPYLKIRFDIKHVELPVYTTGVFSMIKNILYVKGPNNAIFHITGDVHYAILGLLGKKTVLTIHDCVFLNHPGRIKRLILKYLFLKWPVKFCTRVTTISEKSREEIIRHTHCLPDKVVVIPNPADESFVFSEKEFNTKCPVILFIGSTPNKNLKRVIEAVETINCILDIVGKIPSDLQQLMEEKKIQFRQSISLSNEELINKYITCDLVVFPSTYEGFGLPIIEAQQTGRPVITSNMSPMKEVAGEGACLVDPFSVESIREAITTIISDDQYREKIIKMGLLNVQQYKPEKIAGLYADLYQRIHNF